MPLRHAVVIVPATEPPRPVITIAALTGGRRLLSDDLVMLEATGGIPDRSVTMSLSQLMARTSLSCPTVIKGLTNLETLGLVVSTTRERGKVKTFYDRR